MKRKSVIMTSDGTLALRTEEAPEAGEGTVLINVKRSLFSPGTELGGWQVLADSYNGKGSSVKEHTFGYSNCGVIEQTGTGVSKFVQGDRVVAIGAGYAIHADFVAVPQNLVFKLPDNVSFDDGAYVMLMATALHAMRRGEPQFGEDVCIVGLGIVGLLTGALYGLAGNYVAGWDYLPFRLEKAKEMGFTAAFDAASKDLIQETRAFTRAKGLDAAVMAIAKECDSTVEFLVQCMKISPDGHAMGRIMVVGWPTFLFGSNKIGGMNNIDIRRCSRTGFGYHDEKWELGADYPEVMVPWTTQTNAELCLRLMSEKRVAVGSLTTNHLRLSEIAEDTKSMVRNVENVLGVLINCDE